MSVRERVSRTVCVIRTLVLPLQMALTPQPRLDAVALNHSPCLGFPVHSVSVWSLLGHLLVCRPHPPSPGPVTVSITASSMTIVRASRLPTAQVALLQPVPLDPLL